jgi:hypothetical protein
MGPFNIFVIIFMFISMLYFTDLIFVKYNLAKKYKFNLLSLIFFILTLLIGFKGTIGSDYGSYYLDYIYVKENYEDYFQFKSNSLDFFYEILTNLIVVAELEYNYLILLIGFIFVSSIIFFASNEKDYLLIILIFLSYHYLILGMGYVRQGLSLAFLLFFIISWRNQKIILSLFFFILAVLSHKFSIIYGFLIFVRPQGSWFHLNLYFYILMIMGLIFISYFIFKSNNFFYYINVYKSEFSKGAYYRIFAFFLCVILFFSKKSHFKKRTDYRYLFLSANFLILLVPVSLIFSTMADRIASLFLPFALIILGNIAGTLKRVSTVKIKFFLVLVLFTHLFLWTNLSGQAQYYIPFDMLDKPSDKINPYKYMNSKYCC